MSSKQSSAPPDQPENTITTAEAAVAKAYKDSLLDSLRATYKLNKEARCTRVLYIGQMTSTEQKDIIEQIHSTFIESEKENQAITGAFLFINNNLFYHMLEVESLDSLQPLFSELTYEASHDFFESLDVAAKQKKSRLHPELDRIDIKICSISEDITREFPMWSLREVELPGGNNSNSNNNSGNDEKGKGKQNKKAQEDENEEEEVEEDEASLQGVLFETMKGMIEIGRQLCMKHDTDAALKLFQSSQREIISRFPTPDKIEFFLESKLLFDLKAFRQYFFTPIDIKLESEYTWPIEPMISF